MRFALLALLPLCCGQTVLEWTNSKTFTLEVAEKMPAEQYRFKATEAEMSFGALMVHIAMAQAYRFEQVSGIKAPASVAKAGGKLTRDDILGILRASFDYVIAVAPKLSDTEGSGKILNYMAMGLPTVAFDVPVSREYMGDDGCYAAPGDARGLSDRIVELLDDPDGARALGQRLRARAVERYDWLHAGEVLLDVYGRVATAPPSGAL